MDFSSQATIGKRKNLSGRVLVIGDDMRIFLAVVRALGRAGKQVEVAPFGPSPALKSRYISRIHAAPVFDNDPAGWRAAVLAVLTRYTFDLVIPCSDPGISFLDAHRAELSFQRLAIPQPESMSCFYDKEQTRIMAEGLGVPVTPGRRLTDDDTAETLVAAYGLPIVLKPRRTFFAERDQAREIVEILDTCEELERLLAKIDDRSRYLAEAFFDGEGVGVSVLSDNGKVIQAFQHRRLREGRGGVSSLRISEPVDPDLGEACARICKLTKHTGVCMFEFRQNPQTRQWILIETNARFWGSMGLPVALGLDYPNMLFELLVEDRAPQTLAYRAGVRSRNFMLDGYNLAKELRQISPATLTPWLGSISGFLAQPLRWLAGTERSDSFVWDDLHPAFGEFGQAFRKIASLAGITQRGKALIVPTSSTARQREVLQTLEFAFAESAVLKQVGTGDSHVRQAGLYRQATTGPFTEAAGLASKVSGVGGDCTGQMISNRSQVNAGVGTFRIEVRLGEVPGEALFSKTGMFSATPFQDPSWLGAWQASIGDSSKITPVTAIGFVGNTPVLILPLAVTSKWGIRMLTWQAYPLNDYCAPIISNRFLEMADTVDGGHILRQVAESVGGIDLVYLTKTPAEVAGIANPFVIGRSMSYHAKAHSIRLPKDMSFDAFLTARRSSKTRRRIREKLNALKKLGNVEFRFAKTTAEARQVTELCLSAKSRQLQENGFWDPFSNPAAREFLVSFFAGNIGETTWACSFSQGSEVLATAVGFRSPRSWLLYQMSMGDTGKERYSPGTHLLINILSHCIDNKAEELDLGLGDESYKMEWCDTDKELVVSTLAITAKGRAIGQIMKLRDAMLARCASDPRLYTMAKRLQRVAKTLRIPL